MRSRRLAAPDGPGEGAGVATFPALDLEPPPPTVRQRLWRTGRLLLVFVVLAGVGVGGWAAYGAVSGASGPGGPTGSVLTITTIRQLALTDPDGAHPRPFASLGLIAGNGPLWASPDGRTLLGESGDVVTLDQGRPTSHSTALYGAVGGKQVSCGGFAGLCFNTGLFLSAAPFADGGRYVVFSYLTSSGANQVQIVDVHGGTARPLGTAPVADYAGDPQQQAVFATAPEPSQPRGAKDLAIAALQHTAAGGQPTVLRTAAHIAHDLGVRAGRPLAANLLPDRSGGTLALAIRDAQTGDPLGVLVYTRTGQLVGRTGLGPTGQLSWSPKGDRLLFSTGSGAAVWTPRTGAVRRLRVPVTAALLGDCVWAPSGGYAACVGYPGGRGQPYDAWVLVDVGRRTAHAYAAAGFPIVWEG
jgi:hypothetical protein